MRPVLVDTSVWRRFFRGDTSTRPLGELLDEEGVVRIHPFIVGELILGGLSARQELLFRRLPAVSLVPHDDVLALVRRRRLSRKGIGWVDVHLLASALTSSSLLWSKDNHLSSTADALGITFRPEA